jgi:hypothetical protein
MKKRTGGKPKIFITAWGEEKTPREWSEDPRVSLSHQNIQNRYKNYLHDIRYKVLVPRYKSPEDFLTRPLIPATGRKFVVRGRVDKKIIDWQRQVFGPLQNFLESMP